MGLMMLIGACCYLILTNGYPQFGLALQQDAVAQPDLGVAHVNHDFDYATGLDAVEEPEVEQQDQLYMGNLDEREHSDGDLREDRDGVDRSDTENLGKAQDPWSTDVAEDNFMAAFYDTMDLMLPALSMKTLLAPFRDTGEVHMLQLASRVRVFKSLFEAWEKLHLVWPEDGDIVGYRNVIQHLRSASTSLSQVRSSIHLYDLYRSSVNELAARLFPGTSSHSGDHMSLHASFFYGGRGLVVSVGDDQVPFVSTSIQAFRKLGCTLPIEVMYLGDEDLASDLRDQLERLPDVITRDMSRMIDDEAWAAKPWAILYSSFKEAIFVDGDVLFFADPADLFEDQQYRETGALFFKDRIMAPESKRKWLRKVLPKPISDHTRQTRYWTGESGHMQESGVVVVDKWRHFVPLLLTTRLNGIDRDGNADAGRKGVYDMVYGDKETFWLSWEMAGSSDYAFHDGGTGTIGMLEKVKASVSDEGSATEEDAEPDTDQDLGEGEGDDEGEDGDEPRKSHLPQKHRQAAPEAPANYTICSPQLVHRDRNDNPLWLNGWISRDKFKHAGEVDIDMFQFWVTEPPEAGRNTGSKQWELRDNNICCLTADEYTEVTSEQREVLEMIADIVRDVDFSR
ncbi:hypothetical protein LTR17_019097 [Elasticomyces elasticus]|nr:hypothetical protein LTR17_019097 [Elasticomyces elasticus]